MQTTSLHLPSDLLYLLRVIAVNRANRRGGRPSVSDVVRELLEHNRRQLEAEASTRSDPLIQAGAARPGGPRDPRLLRRAQPHHHAHQRTGQTTKKARPPTEGG